MEISIQELEYCKIKVHCEVDVREMEHKKNEVIASFRKAPVKGFRPGKATDEVIKMFYKKQIEDSFKQVLSEEAFHETLFSKNIKPMSQPQFISQLLIGNKFTCEFIMNKKPDFELAQYKDLEIPKPANLENTTALYEQLMQDLRVRAGDQVPYEESDFVQIGDSLILDYEGFDPDGLKINGLGGSGELMTVGKSQVKEFDDNLLGMKVGETREFSLTLPPEILTTLPNDSKVKFICTLQIGSKITPMPLGDDLAKKIGKSDFNELQQAVMSAATARADQKNNEAMTNQVSSMLIESHNFKVPDLLTLSEAKYLASSAKLSWDNLSENERDGYFKMAEKNVKLALILDKIRESEPEAQLSDTEVLDMMKENLSKLNNGVSPDETLAKLNANGFLSVLVARVRDEQTLSFIIKNSKIIE